MGKFAGRAYSKAMDRIREEKAAEGKVIDGRMHVPHEDGMYHFLPLSMDEARDKTTAHPRYIVGDDGRDYQVMDGQADNGKGMTPAEYAKSIMDSGVKPELAIKSEPVIARKALPGEMVTTWSQDGVAETRNMAGPDTYVLTKAGTKTGQPLVDAQGHDNSWIIKKEDFQDAYAVDLDDLEDGSLVQPKSALRTMLPVDRDIAIQTSWGETQKIAAGGMLNITNPDDIYGISARDYADTHVPAPDAAKYLDPAEDNPYWALTAQNRHEAGIAAEMDEDSYDEICRQADALGTSSLTEDDQLVVGKMGREGLEQAWDYLDKTGFGSDKKPHEVDTGRYLRLEFPAGSGNEFDAYESVPVGGDESVGMNAKHVFWNLGVDPSEAAFSAAEGEARTIGVYQGQPFQMRRDEIQAHISENGYGLSGDMYQEAEDAARYLKSAQPAAPEAGEGPARTASAQAVFREAGKLDEAEAARQPQQDGHGVV